jgi:hypothetical protein
MPHRFYLPTPLHAWNLCRKYGLDFYEIKKMADGLPLPTGARLCYNYIRGYYVMQVM